MAGWLPQVCTEEFLPLGIAHGSCHRATTVPVGIDGDKSPWEDDSAHQGSVQPLVIANSLTTCPGDSSPSSGK